MSLFINGTIIDTEDKLNEEFEKVWEGKVFKPDPDHDGEINWTDISPMPL